MSGFPSIKGYCPIASGKVTWHEINEAPIIDVETGEDMRDSEGGDAPAS